MDSKYSRVVSIEDEAASYYLPTRSFVLFYFIFYFLFRLCIIGMKQEISLIVMTYVYFIYYDDDEN